MQLLAERAAMRRQGFALDDANAAAVAAICVRLDGIPPSPELDGAVHGYRNSIRPSLPSCRRGPLCGRSDNYP